MSSLSLFERRNYHCGLQKILPAHGLTTFSIYHYYQQRHVSWTSVYAADKNIRAGYHFASTPRVEEEIPSCWEEGVRREREEEKHISHIG